MNLAIGALIILSIWGAVALGYWYLGRWSLQFQEMLLAMRPKDFPEETVSYSLIREIIALDAKTSILMWQGLGSSPFWEPLQQKFQQDVRGFIHKAQECATANNPQGNAFYSGAAWWCSMMATAPEREIKTAQYRMELERIAGTSATAGKNPERRIPGRSW
jgi:hypothetical protein